MAHTQNNKKIIATVILALMISFGIYIIIVDICVDSYLEDNKRELSILNFYDTVRKNETDRIYFIGSSQIVDGIDSYIIEDYLKTKNYTFQIYNLGIQADCPLLRITELDRLVESKPRLVVIGVNYNGLYNHTTLNDERLVLVSDKVTLDNCSEQLYTEKQLKLINQNLGSIEQYIYKRKFIRTSISYLFFSKGIVSEDVFGEDIIRHFNPRGNDFKNPYVYTRNKTQEELLESLESKGLVQRWCTVHEADNPDKKALNYTIKKLEKNNISVIVINMPLHPLLSEKVPDTTRENYFSFLNSTGVTYYDFETNSSYSPDHFIDLTHLNVVGRNRFSREVGTIIYEGVRAGVI